MNWEKNNYAPSPKKPSRSQMRRDITALASTARDPFGPGFPVGPDTNIMRFLTGEKVKVGNTPSQVAFSMKLANTLSEGQKRKQNELDLKEGMEIVERWQKERERQQELLDEARRIQNSLDAEAERIRLSFMMPTSSELKNRKEKEKFDAKRKSRKRRGKNSAEKTKKNKGH